MICASCRRRPSDYDDRALCAVCADDLDRRREHDDHLYSRFVAFNVDMSRQLGDALSFECAAADWLQQECPDMDDDARAEWVAYASAEWQAWV